jgi:hypothetical protein
MGLYKGTVQNIVTGSYMLPSADDKRKINVSKEKVQGKTKREEVIYQEAQHTSFWTRGLKSYKKEEKNYQKGEIHRQISKDRIYGTGTSIVLSIYPIKFGYSLGG